jgi:hypothetical protein
MFAGGCSRQCGVKFPGCTVGAAYDDAVLQVAGARYELEDVTITSCSATPGASGGGEPTLSLTATYINRKPSKL